MSGTILAIFQPNEEIPGGAQAMIDDGLYEICPVPDIMLVLDVGMSKAGLVAMRTGPVLPVSDYIDISIVSEGIGSNLSECPEPVSLCSCLITRFQRLLSNDIDSSEFATLVCRDFHPGEPGALFPNSVNLPLETKTTKSEVWDQIFGAVKANTEAECGVFVGRVKASVYLKSRAPITLNDRRLAETLQICFGEYFGERILGSTNGHDCGRFCKFLEAHPQSFSCIGSSEARVLPNGTKESRKGGISSNTFQQTILPSLRQQQNLPFRLGWRRWRSQP